MARNARPALRRQLCSAAVRLLVWLSASVCCCLLAVLIGYICWRGLPGLSWELLTSEESLLQGTAGLLPSLLNTLCVVAVSLAAALPLGVGAAIYLTEYARSRRLTAAVEFASEVLSGIPSILYALVGVIVFCSALGLQKTLLAGSLTLAIMTLPTILRTAQESLRTVPRSYREGALSLGSGRWRMIATVVLPSCVDGIVTGCILAAGRVVGESAVLMYTAGLSTAMQDFSTIQGIMRASGSTLAVALYVYAKERADFAAAFAAATVLLALSALINLAARLAGRRLGRRQRRKKHPAALTRRQGGPHG